jgi:hypothetical protein
VEEYQLRVVKEKRENDTKAKALSNFIGLSAVFETLDSAEQERLKVQCEIMWQLSEVLGERIEGFLSIMDCGCRFESFESNTVLLCEKCSELPCHSGEL